MKKIVVIGVIALFIGVSITQSTGKIDTSKTNINDGSLLGYVNDTSGNLIEGALVRVYFHGTYEEDYSDSTGYYHVTNIPICYCLKNATCSKEGYKTEWVLLGIYENTTHDFILTSENQPPDIPIILGYENETLFLYTIDPDGDDVKYFIDWDDGQDPEETDWYPSGQIVGISHSWSEGLYNVKVKAMDIYGAESPWSDPYTIKIGHDPPSKPIIDGPTHGKVGVEYTYTFNSTDSDGEHCFCHVDWGDGSPIEIVNPTWYNPGESGPGIANHSWDIKGTYLIRARAEDMHGRLSDWGTLTVTMPRDKATNNMLFWRLLERFPLLDRLLNIGW